MRKYPTRKIPDVLAELPPEQWKKKHWDLRLGHFVDTIPERIATMFGYLELQETGDVAEDLLNIGKASLKCFRSRQFYAKNPEKSTFVFGQNVYPLGPDKKLTEQGESLATDIGLVMAKHLQALAPEKIDWVMDKAKTSFCFAFPVLCDLSQKYPCFPVSEVPLVVAAHIGDNRFTETGWLYIYQIWEKKFENSDFLKTR